jgi:hypothetical protein
MQPDQPTGVPQPQPQQPAQPVVPSAPQPTPTIAPQPAAPVQQPAPAPAVVAPPAPQPVPAATAPQPQPAPIDQQSDEQTDEYYDDDEGDEEYDEEELSEPVNWQAQEFIHQEKGATWFIIFGVVFAVFMAVAIFLMQSWTFAVLLVVIAAVIVVFAKRPPRIMSYSLSEKGLHIGDTLHNFSDFKSFGVIHDGDEFSVMLIPTKRFQPGVSVYFPESSGEDIVDILGSRLPMKELHLDIVDKIVRKLRL